GHTYRNNYKIQVSEAAKLRMQMYHGQEQMMHVVNIAKVLSKIAPPGIQEYLEYNLSAFEACGKAFDLVNKYARNIEKLSNEVEQLWLEVLNNKNSKENTMMTVANETRKGSPEAPFVGIRSYRNK
ncbi:MAG: hypothetical protein WCS27_13600, partial [Victivallaceae bacterium]